MPKREAIQNKALQALMHHLNHPHTKRLHSNPSVITSDGDYYTTLTFRTADLAEAMRLGASALEGMTPAEADLEQLEIRKEELEEKIRQQREIVRKETAELEGS